MKNKVVSLSDAVKMIQNDSTLAIGGHTLRRHPMALVAEIIRQKKNNLHIMGWNNAIEMDMLIGADCVKTVETSYIGIPNFGLGLNYRRKAENGEIKVLEHSEITALDMFRAGSMGLSFMPNKTPLGNDISKYNEHLRTVTCPFTGEEFGAVQAAKPDVAILHAHTADKWGNVQLDAKNWRDNSPEIYLAMSSKQVIVSVEQIVSDDYVLNNPNLTFLPRAFVTAIVEAPYGAYPCCCDTRYTFDLDHVGTYYEASKSEKSFKNYLNEWVYNVSDHNQFLEKVGIKKLLEIDMGRGIL